MNDGERPHVWTGHLVLHGADPERSARFYEAIGMRRVALLPNAAIMELRGGTHLVVRMAEETTGGPAPFDLMVDDLHETRRRWEEAGLAVSMPSRDELDIHDVFTVTDPDGNIILVNNSHVVGPV